MKKKKWYEAKEGEVDIPLSTLFLPGGFLIGGKGKIKALPLLSIILGVIGYFIAAVIFGPLAIIIGAVALTQVKDSDNKILSCIGIGIGIIDIIGWALALQRVFS